MEEWKKEFWKAPTLLDTTNPDISAFRKNGGKLIILHGTADRVLALSGTIDYYNKFVEKFGQRPLNNFVKFYIVPGYGHGKESVFTMGRNVLQDLDHWVVSKEEPGNLVVTDQNEKTKGRALPLQVYPGYPRYSGNGNVNSAAIYVYGSLANGR
ncbi:tannase/feruloyl esterase family alpha/beta hydrolase [Anaerosinus gibii]|uniref:Tannase/feruloyl esterase family alpha/beta hydrolase n=1 Tax=Selenobaculum gibii TaxID=3054208 RepID=A0A9Y2AHN0_9FIRM|nr:tannase/feruloyl esterase family alpha/beta hydrolase [Selenobaculum gbiensis]WIW71950.1 tannase/feruloyl esterase family alpha/beta hydrolase [Selenobaculum gbiensis]